MLGFGKNKEIDVLKVELIVVCECLLFFDDVCGIGFWEVLMLEGDVVYKNVKWVWLVEFCRFIGYQSEVEFFNVMEFWFDWFYLDDVVLIFVVFGEYLKDKIGCV